MKVECLIYCSLQKGTYLEYEYLDGLGPLTCSH
jgi:hypothetical protein